MKLSIVIPLYNKALYVRETLQSLLDQKMFPHELIIVDDKSTDNSLKVVHQFLHEAPNSFKQSVRIEIIESKENKGIGYTRNIGFKKTSGDHVCFLDADDIFVPDLIQRTADLMSSASLDFLVFGIKMFPSGIEYPNLKEIDGLLSSIDHESYRLDHPLMTVTRRSFVMGLGSNVIARRSLMESIQFYEDGKLGEGTDYWYRVLRIAYEKSRSSIGLLMGNYLLVREVEESASRKGYERWDEIDYPPTLIRYAKSNDLYDKLMMDVMGRRWLQYSGGSLTTRKQRLIFRFNYRKLYRKHLYYKVLRTVHATRPPEYLKKR